MKYFAYGFIGLAVLFFVIEKPLLMLACILPMWAYAFLLAKLFRLKKLTKLKRDKTTSQILGFSVGIFAAVFIGGPFATVVFPWLIQCVDQPTLILPVPTLAIASIILSPPIMYSGLRIAEMVISK